MAKLLLAAAVLAAIWYMWRKRRPGDMRVEEALRTLDLPDGADADAVRAAHRRLIARVHPDAGGNAALAQRINVARDVLLRQIEKGPR